MHRRIIVEVRQQFGADVIHPACETSRAFASIAGTVTITRHALRVIQRLGYGVTVRPHAGFDAPASRRVTAAVDTSTPEARVAASIAAGVRP